MSGRLFSLRALDPAGRHLMLWTSTKIFLYAVMNPRTSDGGASVRRRVSSPKYVFIKVAVHGHQR